MIFSCANKMLLTSMSLCTSTHFLSFIVYNMLVIVYTCTLLQFPTVSTVLDTVG